MKENLKKKNVKFNNNINVKLFNKNDPTKNINFKSFNNFKHYLIFISIILLCIVTKIILILINKF